MSLYEDTRHVVQDRRASALVIEEVMEPTKGAIAAICPPTYSGGEKGIPHYAVTDRALIPARSTNGWHHDNVIIDGAPRLAKRVVVNAIPACADGAETALYHNQERLGVRFPALIVDARTVDDARIKAALVKAKRQPESSTAEAQIRAALQFRVGSWDLAHRGADSWVMFAQAPGGNSQVWATDGGVKDILLNIAHESGDNVYRYTPNAALFGNWLSAGTARRHAIPRSYSCEITGYGATDVVRAATKLDRAGGSTKYGRKLTASGAGVALGATGREPSELGFGQVPTSPAVRGFQCELILRQASIAMRALDRFTYTDDRSRTKAQAAKTVYTLLGIAGHLLAQEDGFLRSECDLITVEERWGWRQHGTREPRLIEVPSVDETADALQRSIRDAESVGLVFAEEIILSPSDAQVGLIVDRVLEEGSLSVKADR